MRLIHRAFNWALSLDPIVWLVTILTLLAATVWLSVGTYFHLFESVAWTLRGWL